jgi:hypothetical protein
MIVIYLSLLIVTLLISVYSIKTAMYQEEFFLNQSHKQAKEIYGRHHPKMSDPGLNVGPKARNLWDLIFPNRVGWA